MKRQTKDLIAYSIAGAAVMLTAWKGSLDWMGLVAVAVIFKMPGYRQLRDIVRRKDADSCDPRE
jgi:hypothetical protein